MKKALKDKMKSDSKPKTKTEEVYESLCNGTPAEYKCYKLVSGLLSTSTNWYKISLDVNGNMIVYQIDQKANDSIK